MFQICDLSLIRIVYFSFLKFRQILNIRQYFYSNVYVTTVTKILNVVYYGSAALSIIRERVYPGSKFESTRAFFLFCSVSSDLEQSYSPLMQSDEKNNIDGTKKKTQPKYHMHG